MRPGTWRPSESEELPPPLKSVSKRAKLDAPRNERRSRRISCSRLDVCSFTPPTIAAMSASANGPLPLVTVWPRNAVPRSSYSAKKAHDSCMSSSRSTSNLRAMVVISAAMRDIGSVDEA